MLPRYLVQTQSGFYFRIIVPKRLRALFGQSVIKRTLRTHDPRIAQAWSLVLADRYAQAFVRADRAMPDKTLDELLRSATEALTGGSGKEYKIGRNRHGTFTVETDGTETDHKQAMEMLAQMQKQPPAHTTPMPSISDIEAIAPTGLKRITLKKAIEEYKDRIRPDPKKKSKVKTFTATSRALSEFEQWAGPSQIVYKLTRNDLAQFATFLLGSVIKSTVRDKLSCVTGFFNWAQNSQYFAKGDNPAQGHITITKRDKKESAKRGWQSFDHEQLKTLYAPENFAKLDRDATRWIALLELYTGARPNELAQIDLDDCKQIGGQFCIEITDIGDDKRTKTDASERFIPVHDELIALGFLEKVSAMKMAKQTRLFPDLNRETLNGPSQVVGKDFTKYLSDLSIKARGDGTVGLRSLRPTVITELAESGVAQGWREKFVGHEQSEGTQATDHAVVYTQSKLIDAMVKKCLPPLSWGQKGIVDIEKLKPLLK